MADLKIYLLAFVSLVIGGIQAINPWVQFLVLVLTVVSLLVKINKDLKK
jgi:hypothetical protein